MILSESFLESIITEQLNILLEEEPVYLYINGQPYTLKQYKEFLKSRKQPQKPVKKTPTQRQIDAMLLKNRLLSITDEAKAINNMFSFYNNGYRYFGSAFNKFMNYYQPIKDNFDGFSLYAGRYIESLIKVKASNQSNVIKAEIDEIIKNLDNATNKLKKIVAIVNDCGVLDVFHDSKVLYGSPTMAGYIKATRNCNKLFEKQEDIISRLNSLLGSNQKSFKEKNTPEEQNIIDTRNQQEVATPTLTPREKLGLALSRK